MTCEQRPPFGMRPSQQIVSAASAINDSATPVDSPPRPNSQARRAEAILPPQPADAPSAPTALRNIARETHSPRRHRQAHIEIVDIDNSQDLEHAALVTAVGVALDKRPEHSEVGVRITPG